MLGLRYPRGKEAARFRFLISSFVFLFAHLLRLKQLVAFCFHPVARGFLASCCCQSQHTFRNFQHGCCLAVVPVHHIASTCHSPILTDVPRCPVGQTHRLTIDGEHNEHACLFRVVVVSTRLRIRFRSERRLPVVHGNVPTPTERKGCRRRVTHESCTENASAREEVARG